MAGCRAQRPPGGRRRGRRPARALAHPPAPAGRQPRRLPLLHHAEAIARAPGKRRLTYTVRHAPGEDRTYTDIDTEHGAYPYELDDDVFATIAGEALAAGIGVSGKIAAADCHLFPAAELTAFAVAWLDERFGA